MGSGDSRIETSAIPPHLLRTPTPPLPAPFIPPFRKFGELLHKTAGSTTTYHLSLLEPYREQFSVSTEVFPVLKDAFDHKTEAIEIDSLLRDEEVVERWLFQARADEKRLALIVRPFQNADSHTYANILTEIHFAQTAAPLSAHLHQLQETYAVHSGIDALGEPNSQVLVMEAVDANLAQIIGFRRANRWDWGEAQFLKLMHDLVDGLHALHQAGISHNDIRPANIYFSVGKNCYLIGSYATCSKGQGNSSSTRMRGDSEFNAPELSHQPQVDLLQGDVYSLGLTLLCAFYLAQPLDRKVLAQQNKIFADKHEVVGLLQSMIAPASERVTIAAVMAKLPSTSFAYENMKELLNSMQHRSRPSPSEASSAKLATSWAYQRLGLWNEWKQQYEEGYQLVEATMDTPAKADALNQLALIDHCRGEYENSSNYAKRAAKLYRSLGEQEIEEGVLGQAETYYKKAIACSHYYEFEYDLDLATSLQGLSKVHTEKNEYMLAKTLAAAASNTVAKAEGKDSLEWCNFKLKEARLETEFGAFETADKILEESLQIARKKEGFSDKAKAVVGNILKEKGYNFMKQASHQEEAKQEVVLLKADTNLKEALDIFDAIDSDHHYEVALIAKTFGQVQFKRQNYEKAQQDFTKAIDLLFRHETLAKKETRDKADVLCLRGISQSFLKPPQQEAAVDDFDQALKVYKRLYGSDHNRWTALAMGNLGRVYANGKELLKARECLKVCLSILGDVAGREDPDYQHFASIEQHLDQLV